MFLICTMYFMLMCVTLVRWLHGASADASATALATVYSASHRMACYLHVSAIYHVTLRAAAFFTQGTVTALTEAAPMVESVPAAVAAAETAAANDNDQPTLTLLLRAHGIAAAVPPLAARHDLFCHVRMSVRPHHVAAVSVHAFGVSTISAVLLRKS